MDTTYDIIKVTHPTSGAWHDSFPRDTMEVVIGLIPDTTVRDRIALALEETPAGTVQIDLDAHEWGQLAIGWSAYVGRS
jgi:hypothetical protein